MQLFFPKTTEDLIKKGTEECGKQPTTLHRTKRALNGFSEAKLQLLEQGMNTADLEGEGKSTAEKDHLQELWKHIKDVIQSDYDHKTGLGNSSWLRESLQKMDQAI